MLHHTGELARAIAAYEAGERVRGEPRWLERACMHRPMGGRLRHFSPTGAPASAPFSPKQDAASLLWWDPTTLTDGAVSSWTDRIASVAATQATGSAQPTRSATAIGGAYPGVSSDGGDLLAASGAGAVLGGKTALTLVAAMVDSSTSVSIAIEYTAAASTNDGGFNVAVNDVAAGQITPAVRGTTGITERRCSESLAAVKIVSIGYDFATAGAGALAFIRVNGVAQSLTNVTASSAAGSAANSTLYLFARSGVTLPWSGTLGDLVIRDSKAQDADLAALESWMAARVGLSL